MQETTVNQVADTLLETGIKVTITEPAARVPVWRRMFKKQQNNVYELVLPQLPLGKLIQISKLVNTIQPDLLQGKAGVMDAAHAAINAHGETVIMIAAIALSKQRNEPEKWLVRLIRDNVTAKELLVIFTAILQQLDVTAFMSSIISIRGVNLIKMNPQTQGS
jgi:hypothetical protein